MRPTAQRVRKPPANPPPAAKPAAAKKQDVGEPKCKMTRSSNKFYLGKLAELEKKFQKMPGICDMTNCGSLTLEVTHQLYEWAELASGDEDFQLLKNALEVLPGRYYRLGDTPRSLEDMEDETDSFMAIWRQEPPQEEGAPNSRELFLFWSVQMQGWVFSTVCDLSGEVYKKLPAGHEASPYIAFAYAAKGKEWESLFPDGDDIHAPYWKKRSINACAGVVKEKLWMGPTVFWLEQSCFNLANAQGEGAGEEKTKVKPEEESDDDKQQEQDTRQQPIGAPFQRSGVIGMADGKEKRRSGWMEKAATMASLYQQGKYWQLEEYLEELSQKFPQFEKCKNKPYNRF